MVQALRSGASTTRPTRGFVMVPMDLLLDTRVNGDDIRLWAVLDDLQRDEPHADATTHQLAEVLHCSHDTVQRRVDKLVDAGWLTATRRRGLQRANRYVVLHSPRRRPASSGTRTGARSSASSQDHATVRVPSAVLTTEEEKSSCPNKECVDGWVEVTVEGRFGVSDAVARCPFCNARPAPF